MEKLPEKWFIKNNYQEVRDWLADKYHKEIKDWVNFQYIGFAGVSSHRGALGGSAKSHENYGGIEITFDQFKRLVLGETEEKFKIGKCYKWYQKNHESHHYGKVLKVEGDFVTMSPWISNCTTYYGDGTFDIEKSIEITEIPISVISKFCPKEIPQEEVEYVECILNKSPINNYEYTIGKIYNWPKPFNDKGREDTEIFTLEVWLKWFKPSTREAYEAQQTGKRRTLMDDVNDILSPIEKVNKCSTINTNQNECKNEKGSETKSPLDRNTGAKTGQSIRLRTTGVRIKCKSGLLRSGKEVTRTVKSSPRPKAEIGRRFTKGRS